NEVGHAPLGRGQPVTPRPSADRPELPTGTRGPAAAPMLLDAPQRLLDGLPCLSFLPCTPSRDAEGEERSRPAEGIAHSLVLLDGVCKQLHPRRDLAPP